MDTEQAVDQLLLRDDFTGAVSGVVDGSHWRLRPVPGFPGGDGIPATGPGGLVVTPTTVDPATGHPAFADPPQPLGEADHLRWALMCSHESSHGFPGYDISAPGSFSVSSDLSVLAYGLERHTYGDAVTDPHRDLRLGSAALICMDRETGVVFDFIVANHRVFAVYERLAFPGTTHAGFSYAVPVADRRPDEFHHLRLQYDAVAATASWHVADQEVLRVDRIGYRALPERYVLRDNDKPDQQALPRQLTCGLALFADRLFGQGVRLAVRGVEVRRGI